MRIVAEDRKNPTKDTTCERDWKIYKHMFHVFLWVNKLVKGGEEWILIVKEGIVLSR